MMLVIISNALTAPGGITIADAVRSAIVHAWYEGHIEGEDRLRPVPPAVSSALADLPEDAFPMPPFPTVPPVQAMVHEVLDLFGEGVPEAAVAYAAAIAWRQGYAEGASCSGCSFRGAAPGIARELRSASAKVRVHSTPDVEERALAAHFDAFIRRARSSKPQPPAKRRPRPRASRA